MTYNVGINSFKVNEQSWFRRLWVITKSRGRLICRGESWVLKELHKSTATFSIVSHCCLTHCDAAVKAIFRENRYSFLLYTLIVLMKTEVNFLIIWGSFIMYLHWQIIYLWIFVLVSQSLYHKKINLGLYWPALCSENQASGTTCDSVYLTPKWVFIFHRFSVVQKFILALLL